MLSVSLLGGLCIRNDKALITGVDTPRLQALLAYLLLHSDAPQPRAHLAFLFWPDTTEQQARTNLRNLLHQLRYAFPGSESYIETSMQTLQWRSDIPFILDVAEFKAVLAQVKQVSVRGDFTKVREPLERAIDLYGGDLLPSCYDDWIIPHREGLRQAYLDALERLVGMLEEQRDYPAAIQYSQRLLREDPLQETTYRNLMRLHALHGDRAGALRVYHTCMTVLQRELEVEPSLATREAYQQLLGVAERISPSIETATVISPLVGRDKEWSQLLHAWRAAEAGGKSHVVILRGEAGIGKTRLGEELLQWAARQGIAKANARCYAAEGDLAFAPITTWLRTRPLGTLDDVWLAEVARILPEVLVQRPDLPRPLALTEAWQRQRLLEALSRAILSINQPLLLTIDDLQWCDRDTLEWLHFLLRFDQDSRILIVGNYRPEEIEESHPLVAFLQALRLEGQVTEMDLHPLDEIATKTLAGIIAGVEISKQAAQILYRETEGNPFFVVEIVRAGLPGQEQPLNAVTVQKLPPDSSLDTADLPIKVKSILMTRLAQLSPNTRELAGLAATIGREFGFKLLSRTSNCDEDTLVHQLDELWRRRIIREHGVDAYDFTHDKLREVAYLSMSTARRQMLHRNIAQAMEELYKSELDLVSHQLAVHYERASLPEEAIPCYLRAAKVARRVYANEEAIALLQHGIAIGEALPRRIVNNLTGVLMHLWEELGDIFEMRAQHDKAKQGYRSAMAYIPHSDQLSLARLYRKVGIALWEERLYFESLDACRSAELALGKVPEEGGDEWWCEWIEVQVDRIWSHYWLAQWPEMEMLVDKVQPVVQARGSVISRIRFLMGAVLLHLRKERYIVSDEMMAYQHEAFFLCRGLDDLRVKVDIQFELGFLFLWRRELDEAEENLLEALKLSKISEILPRQTLSLTYLTVLYRFRGQIDDVMNYAELTHQAALAAHMPDYVAAAKGNQAWLAWREGDLHTAEQIAKESLAIWQQSPLVYPFQWQASWPLIGVTLADSREDEAWAYVQRLIEPTQQYLPAELNTKLEAAIQAKGKGQSGKARSYLDRAVVLAREMNYL